MATIMMSEDDMPKRGSRVKFIVAKNREEIKGITSVSGPNRFIEGYDPGNLEARSFYWNEVYQYSTPIWGDNYID